MVRYTNVFTLKYELLKEETDPVDLLGLTALQVFEPSMYSKLPLYKDVLCGDGYRYSIQRQKEEEKRVRDTVSLILPNTETSTNLEAARHILAILFPRTKAATDNSYFYGRTYSQREFLINNNIAAPECFDRYFALTLENTAIPTATIKELIFQLSETVLNNAIVRLYEEGKVTRLLEEIAAYANNRYSFSVPPERASMLITALARNWSLYEVVDREPLSIPFNRRFLLCVDLLLKIINLQARFSYMHTLFNDESIQPSTLALLLQDFEAQHGRFTEKEEASSRDDALFTLDEVLLLESIFEKRAMDALDSGVALKQNNGLNFLWMLEQLAPEQAVNKEKALVSDDVSLMKVISYGVSKGTISTKIATKTRVLDRQKVSKFVDIDEGYRRAKRFSKSKPFFTLSENDQMNAVAFILIMERTPSTSTQTDSIAEGVVAKALKQMEENTFNM